MQNFFTIYATVVFSTVILYHLIKSYVDNKRLRHFRSQLSPGQCVSIKGFGTYHQAEIINLHDGLIFCHLNQSGLYSYVDPSNIYPYEY